MNRFLNYIFVLILSSLNSQFYESEFGTFSIYMNDNIYANKELAKSIKEMTNGLVNKFGRVNHDHFNVYIYDDNKKFQQSCSYIKGWEAGLAINKSPQIIIIKGPQIQSYGISQFIKVLEHELSHIYLFRRADGIRLPDWFEEGFAMHIANEFTMNKKILISESFWQRSTIEESSLRSFRNVSRTKIPLCYAQSAAFFRYIVSFKSVREILDSISSYNNFYRGIESATQIRYSDIVLNLENSVLASYKWYILIRFSKYIFYITPFILVIGYIVTRRRNKKTLNTWELEELIDDTDWESHAES